MHLQTKLTLGVGAILMVVFAAVSWSSYRVARDNAINNLEAQADKVRNLLMTYRRTQQKVFVDYKVPLTETTLRFLPAFAIGTFSKDYPNWDNSGFSFNNVSDQPRNPEHKADALELEVMEYFRQNPKQERVFRPFQNTRGEDYYLYARPIWIEESCIKCHGKREDAPPTIRDLYDSAWNYKVGDLRGLLSIKLPATTVTAQAWSSFKRSLLLNLAGFIAIFVFITVFIRRNVGGPLHDLVQGMQAVEAGDHARRMSGFQGEFALLGDTFNHMTVQVQQQQKALRVLNSELEQRVEIRTAELAAANQEIQLLNTQLESENQRLSTELEVTSRLQTLLLPHAEELLNVPGLDIAAYTQAATEVSGDYYDVLHHAGQTQIAIGDVTGHGLESGMLMLMVQTAVRTLQAQGINDPMAILKVVNQVIFANVQRMRTDKNLTLVLLHYHAGALALSGQHEEVLIVRRDGNVERVDTVDLGFMVGLKSEIGELLQTCNLRLNQGDSLVLYTDGLTEAFNPLGKQYGVGRLSAVLSQHAGQSAQAIINAVVADVRCYMDGRAALDDVTLLVLKQTA